MLRRKACVFAAAALLALVGTTAATAASPPPGDTDYLLAAGTFPGCCGDATVWVKAWIGPRRNHPRGKFSWVNSGLSNRWFMTCLNVQGHEAAVVVGNNFYPFLFIQWVFRDNGRKPDELVSMKLIYGYVPSCDFVPGQPAQITFDGDVKIHDAP